MGLPTALAILTMPVLQRASSSSRRSLIRITMSRRVIGVVMLKYISWYWQVVDFCLLWWTAWRVALHIQHANNYISLRAFSAEMQPTTFANIASRAICCLFDFQFRSRIRNELLWIMPFRLPKLSHLKDIQLSSECNWSNTIVVGIYDLIVFTKPQSLRPAI